MIKFRTKVVINNNTVFNREDKSYNTIVEGSDAIRRHIRQTLGQVSNVLGEKGQLNICLSWECTMNSRAPARPKDVIAAEKAARAAKRAAEVVRHKEWEKEQAQRVINIRNRIKSQVDHAFGVGKHGTESAAKYITCDCDAPAVALLLTSLPAQNAHVLDEDLITGAVCLEHNKRRRQTPQIECDKLEFFYDGVRQIAIKAAP